MDKSKILYLMFKYNYDINKLKDEANNNFK